MKKPVLLGLSALFGIVASCDRTNPEFAKRLADLEAQTAAAEAENAKLTQELAEQALAAERDAIERERQALEDQRIQLDQLEAAQAEQARQDFARREAELEQRETQLQNQEFKLSEQADLLDQRGKELAEKDQEIAGREALIDDSSADSESTEPEQPTADFGTFHESLTPYGSWFETPSYGYVFQPIVVREVGWRPYTRGRWVCSSHGWTWVSDEPFGWATYHYGRWTCLDGRGWVWVPGSDWAPAWVTWRHGGNHTGWAPLPPETLAYRDFDWGSNVEATFGIGSTWFTYIETSNFCEPVRYHCLPYHLHHEHYGYTRNVSHIYRHNRGVFCGGPSYREVNHHAKRRVPYYNIEFDRYARGDRSRIGSRPSVRNGVMTVSAPRIDADWNAAIRPRIVRGKIEKEAVVGTKTVAPEIRNRYQESRLQESRKAEDAVSRLGGPQRFEAVRRQLIVNHESRKSASRPDQSKAPAKQANQIASSADRILKPKTLEKPLNPKSPRQDQITAAQSAARPASGKTTTNPSIERKPNTAFRSQTKSMADPHRQVKNPRIANEAIENQTRQPKQEPARAKQAEADAPSNHQAREQPQREAQQENARRQQAEQQQRAANQAREQQQREAQQENARRQQAEQQQRAANQAREQQQREAQQENARRQQAEQEQREAQQEQARRSEMESRQRAEQQQNQRAMEQRAQAQRENESRQQQSRSSQGREQNRNDDESNRKGRR